MRPVLALVLLLALAGCGRGPEARLIGSWVVDPATIQSSRLAVGAEQKREWEDAKTILSRIAMDFKGEPKTVEATGFGMKSTATWKLEGDKIQISGSKEVWPTMTLDSKADRIRAAVQMQGETLHLELVKAK